MRSLAEERAAARDDRAEPVRAGDSRDASSDDVLDVEPGQISERGVAVGEERLRRSSLDILVTAVIGGVEVSFGGLAGALVIGAVTGAAPGITLPLAVALAGLVFPAGFAFVIFGRSELFTENFLIPVLAVVGRRLRPRDLLRLWALSWLGNMAGCALIALLARIPEGLGASIIRGYTLYADHKLSSSPLGTFGAALLAGAVMTVLTWLLLAARPAGAKLTLIWGAGYVLFAANLSHAVVGAAMIFIGFSHTGYGLLAVARWLGLATAGNLVGGVGFVTLFRLVQIWEKGGGAVAPEGR